TNYSGARGAIAGGASRQAPDRFRHHAAVAAMPSSSVYGGVQPVRPRKRSASISSESRSRVAYAPRPIIVAAPRRNGEGHENRRGCTPSARASLSASSGVETLSASAIGSASEISDGAASAASIALAALPT